MGKLTPEKIRQNMQIWRDDYLGGNEGHCLSELFDCATNPDYLGYEDPKSYADYLLDNGGQRCTRTNCDVTGVYDRIQSIAQSTGECALDAECLGDIWEKTEYDRLGEVSIVRPSSEQIGFLCAKNTCDFNCGFSLTEKGQFEECVNVTRITVTKT